MPIGRTAPKALSLVNAAADETFARLSAPELAAPGTRSESVSSKPPGREASGGANIELDRHVRRSLA
jgi:hypothetical protein